MKNKKFVQVALPVLVTMGITFVILMFMMPKKYNFFRTINNEHEDSVIYNSSYVDYTEPSEVINDHSLSIGNDTFNDLEEYYTLEELKDITELKLDSISNEEFEQRLESECLPENTVASLKLSPLEKFVNLKKLTVSPDREYYDDENSIYYNYKLDTSSIQKLAKLEELSVEGMEITDLSFAKKTKLNKIEFIDCDFSKIKPAEFQALSKITVLSLDGELKGLNLGVMLNYMPAIQELNLNTMEFKEFKDLQKIKQLDRLDTISFVTTSPDTKAYQKLLESLPKVKKLSIALDVLDYYEGLSTYDFSFLGKLTQLEQLSLGVKEDNEQESDTYGYKVIDYSYLGNLKNLSSLTLHRMKMEDISFVSSLTNLKKLDISNNFVQELTSLSGLTKLEELDLTYNMIMNIEPLSPLVKIRKLALGNNKIQFIEALRNMDKLEELDLASGFYILDDPNHSAKNIMKRYYGEEEGRTSINCMCYSTYNPKSMDDMTSERTYLYKDYAMYDKEGVFNWYDSDNPYMYAVNNQSGYITLDQNEERCYWARSRNSIRDLSPIATAANLRFLDVSGNRIEDISMLKGLNKLQFFSCMDNQIEDISVITKANFPELKFLYLSQNEIKNGDAIKAIDEDSESKIEIQYYMTPFYNESVLKLVEPKESVLHLEAAGFDFVSIIKNLGTRTE